jgi:hypothetical protein
MMGLSLAQIFTIELASISTLSGLLSAMALPRMWPAVPITTLGTIVAAWRPDYACDLAQCLIAGTICATIVLWNRASHSKPTSPSGPSGSRIL